MAATSLPADPFSRTALDLRKRRLERRIAELVGDAPHTPTIDLQTISLEAAEQLRAGLPSRRLVIEDGDRGVVGLLIGDEPVNSAGSDPLELQVVPPVLSVSLPMDNRTIKGWIEGWSRDTTSSERTWRQIADDEPMLKGQTYQLKLEADTPGSDKIIHGQAGDIGALFDKADADEVTILVELVVDESEFRLYEEPSAKLFVPREIQPSKNSVVFNIEPLKTGKLTIKVSCYALQQLFIERQVKVTVTDRASVAVRGSQKNAIVVEPRGLSMAAAMGRSHRRPQGERISLYITEQQSGVYKFILTGANAMRATIRLTKEASDQVLINARREFHDKFILKKHDGAWIYLEPDPHIPPEVYRADLEELSFIGRELFETLFYGRLGEKSDDAARMGDSLRALSKEHTLDIKVVSDRFTFPWQFIYDRPDDGSVMDPDGFWGFKYIIQFLPEFSAGTQVSFSNEIAVQGRLPLTVVFDERIDAQFGFPVIAEQRAIFSGNPDLEVREATKTAEVLKLLRDQDAPPVIYFYVHNESLLPAEAAKKRPELPIGTDASRITTSEGELLLRDIRRRIPTELPKFKNTPLIFLNACQGAELVPGQFDGMLPYLMQRGARGAIGTEVNTPVNFAARFGAELVAEFAKGEKSLGELLLERRRFYRDTHNNIMGLCYALYSDGDLIVQRPSSEHSSASTRDSNSAP